MRKRPSEKKPLPSWTVGAVIGAFLLLLYFYLTKKQVLPPVPPIIRPAVIDSDATTENPQAGQTVNPIGVSGGQGVTPGLTGTGVGRRGRVMDKEKPKYYCRHIKDGVYMVPESFYESWRKAQKVQLLVPDDESRCLQTNLTLKIAFVRQDRNARFPYEYLFSVGATVSSIKDFSSLPYALSSFKEWSATGYGSPAKLSKLFADTYGSSLEDQPVRLVSFDIADKTPNRTMYGVPDLHPLADTVTASSTGSDDVLLDIRSESHFKKRTLPGAVSIPIEFDPLVISEPTSLVYTLIKEQTDALARLSKDRRIVVFTRSPRSTSAYNLVSVLYAVGFTKLAYIRDGLPPEGQNFSPTPVSYRGISAVGLSEAQKLLQSGAAIVDVRKARLFARGSIPKATTNFYAEMPQLPLRTDDMTAKQLIASGESYSLHGMDLKSPVLVYGQNEEDWGALKAAVFLRDAGHRQVFWYRKGFDEWNLMARFEKSVNIQRNSGRKIFEKILSEVQPGQVPKDFSGLPYLETIDKFIAFPKKRLPPTKDETHLYKMTEKLPPRPVQNGE